MKWKILTTQKLRKGDQVLFADYQQDCEAKRRWHRVLPQYFGITAIRYNKFKFRRPV